MKLAGTRRHGPSNRGHRLHFWLGLATVVVFLGTGLYMRYREPPVAELEMGLRMLFRSRHVYILLTGLLNLVLGLYQVRLAHGRAQRVAQVGSALVAVSPLLAIAGFFFEAEVFGAPGPFVVLAAETALGGAVLHLAAVLAARGRSGGE